MLPHLSVECCNTRRDSEERISVRKLAQLLDLFQTNAVVKILDFLTLYKDFEYTRTDIAKETGISRRTLYQVFPILEKFELVKVTKSSGMVRFYKLNMENSISKHLVALADQVSLFQAEKTTGIRPEFIPETTRFPGPLSKDEQPVEITTTIRSIEQTIRGAPSQVRKLRQGRFDLTNGEITIPIQDSTDSESIMTSKKKAQLLWLQTQDQDKMVSE